MKRCEQFRDVLGLYVDGEVAPQVRVIGVEPSRSAVLSGGSAGAHGIPGIGAGFVPGILCVSNLHEVIRVDDGDAYAAARKLARSEGILGGPASGAVLAAAATIAARSANAGKLIVAILPDHGERFGDHSCFACPEDA